MSGTGFGDVRPSRALSTVERPPVPEPGIGEVRL
ncbi:hypothetical protein DFR68_10645 [Nocardia mexicana]|uniref:Uncharacterized protein n=1 Tax=Nocardia mexicana TaxID=279262 RepID=A0A370H631_9NOCA|nr:hypothetical protein DFR68_10645 [Nocardia mexicana]